ncbi:hypothetical protein HDU83_007906 [Entophlyctis luteolus]|nr:hypothetical protein HDU83_007906 [Entophlyctis luteolus]
MIFFRTCSGSSKMRSDPELLVPADFVILSNIRLVRLQLNPPVLLRDTNGSGLDGPDLVTQKPSIPLGPMKKRVHIDDDRSNLTSNTRASTSNIESEDHFVKSYPNRLPGASVSGAMPKGVSPPHRDLKHSNLPPRPSRSMAASQLPSGYPWSDSKKRLKLHVDKTGLLEAGILDSALLQESDFRPVRRVNVSDKNENSGGLQTFSSYSIEKSDRTISKPDIQLPTSTNTLGDFGDTLFTQQAATIPSSEYSDVFSSEDSTTKRTSASLILSLSQTQNGGDRRVEGEIQRFMESPGKKRELVKNDGITSFEPVERCDLGTGVTSAMDFGTETSTRSLNQSTEAKSSIAKALTPRNSETNLPTEDDFEVLMSMLKTSKSETKRASDPVMNTSSSLNAIPFSFAEGESVWCPVVIFSYLKKFKVRAVLKSSPNSMKDLDLEPLFGSVVWWPAVVKTPDVDNPQEDEVFRHPLVIDELNHDCVAISHCVDKSLFSSFQVPQKRQPNVKIAQIELRCFGGHELLLESHFLNKQNAVNVSRDFILDGFSKTDISNEYIWNQHVGLTSDDGGPVSLVFEKLLQSLNVACAL